MNHFAGSERSVIREHNDGVRREVQRLRLESQLRANDRLRTGSGQASSFSRSRLPLLRRSGIRGLEEAMMYQEEVVLYGVARSRSCRRLRRLLRRKGFVFDEIDVGGDDGLLASLSEITGKTILLPLVFLGGRLVGGIDEIEALERSGDLERLVRGRV